MRVGAALCVTALLLWRLAAAQPAPQAAPPAAAPELPLPAAGYVWQPQIAPDGPVGIVVDLRAQRVHVYRNGVRIGLSRASTGRPGFETPPGVYTILQKERTHVSNLYEGAQMPYMQRLTWSGIALHAGTVPDRPASHGCIRLPLPFAQRLFDVTRRGMTVIVSDALPAAPGWLQPAPLAALAPLGVGAAGARPGPGAPAAEAAPTTLVWSVRERVLVVLRDGREIAREPMSLQDADWHGTRAYLLLAGTDAAPSVVAPGRRARRWLEIPLDGAPAPPPTIDRTRIAMDPAFAIRLYDLLTPGATLLVTDQPIGAARAATGPLLDAETGGIAPR